MEKIKLALLAKYLTDNDIDPYEAIKVLEEACRQMDLARMSGREKAILFQYERRQGVHHVHKAG
jgi:hypothetical protein